MVDQTLRELRSHGNSEFPIATYDCCGLDQNNLLVECHWHDEWEFFTIYEGSAVFSINGRKQRLNQYDIAFIPGNHMHMTEPCDHIQCRYRSVVFSMSMLSSSYSDIVQTKYIAPISENRIEIKNYIFYRDDPSGQEACNTFRKLYDTVTCHLNTYEMRTKAYLYELLAHHIAFGVTSSKDTRVMARTTQNIQQAMLFMNHHYPQCVTLPQLADMVSMSVGYFGKMFKVMTSVSPIDYLLNLRLTKAAQRLEETDDKILLIALETGFNNVEYFIRSFQKKYGASPRQYRKRIHTQ